jgi:hypothetical protein
MMDTLDSVCKHIEVNPAKDFFAQGKIHICMVLNLSSFIEETSRDDFERLRGGWAFGKAFKELKPTKYFFEDQDERKTVDRSHKFQVFRGHVKDYWLFPTFCLDLEQAPPPENCTEAKEWNKFLYHIRFSRSGLLEVKLTRSIPTFEQSGSNETLIEVLRSLLEVSSHGVFGTARPPSMKLALHCANLFIEALGPVVEVEEPRDGKQQPLKVPIGLRPIGPNRKSLPQHQRYTILFLDKISCKKCSHKISAYTLWEHHQKTLAALLEGALHCTEDGQFEFPELDHERIKIEDLATWKDELCIFGPEGCLIYYPRDYIFLPGQLTSGPVRYEDYWKCIVRGIEHTLAIRSALQIIEWHTTRALDEVPRLTKRVIDKKSSAEDEIEIQHMAQEVANTFNMLPILRDVLVATSAFRASYAVSKFDHLNTVLQLKEILTHIQRNVDELVIFLNHFARIRVQQASMELQADMYQLQKEVTQLNDQVQEGQSTINRIGVIIALVALLVAGPSFLADFRAFFIEQYGWSEWSIWVFFTPIGLLALFFIFYIPNSAVIQKFYYKLLGITVESSYDPTPTATATQTAFSISSSEPQSTENPAPHDTHLSQDHSHPNVSY